MGVYEDLVGKQYGNLTVVERDENRNGRVYWKCRCDCGNIVSVISTNLKSMKKTHCGCKKKTNIEGKRFGRLVAREIVGENKYGVKIWRCDCDCGNTKDILYSSLIKRETESCGCFKKEANYIHGLNGSRLQGIYYKMLYRCYHSKCKGYDDYGGRGIKICNEWLGEHGLENFAKWAFDNGYSDELTIDRKNNDEDYCPENCRWVDWKTQENNRRNNIFLEYGGEKLTLSQWSEKLNINYKTLYGRYKRGLPIHRVLKK